MKLRRLFFGLATAAGTQMGLCDNAQAMTGLAMMPSTLMLAQVGMSGNCAGQSPSAFGNVASPALAGTLAGTMSGASKSQAILGGAVSRLELIARQQGASSAVGLAANATLPGASLTPGAGGAACSGFTLPLGKSFQFPLGQMTIAPKTTALPSEDFLASKRLPVSRTAFDTQWHRVSRSGVSHGMAAALVGSLAGASNQSRLAAVNAWTNDHVRYVEDQTGYGKADYWANARGTLRRRAGDCEDIAIAKMQLLAALGVPRSDMVLTIARDLARNADHALLVVKQDERYWLLDNATDTVLDASASYDYRPILSYGMSQTWLHGY